VNAAVYDALVDIYAILPLGRDRRGHAVPLLRKPRRSGNEARDKGLTGAALEREVDRWALIFPGRVH
jgi:hypothetical protein